MRVEVLKMAGRKEMFCHDCQRFVADHSLIDLALRSKTQRRIGFLRIAPATR
jgi:hypothetical protein